MMVGIIIALMDYLVMVRCALLPGWLLMNSYTIFIFYSGEVQTGELPGKNKTLCFQVIQFSILEVFFLPVLNKLILYMLLQLDHDMEILATAVFLFAQRTEVQL